jgi:FkbM family methyltransferase
LKNNQRVNILLVYVLRIFFRIPGTKLFYIRVYNLFKLPVFSFIKKTIVFKNKFKLILNLEDWIQNQIYFLGSYEKFELSILEKSLNKGDTFIDIGANFGLYSLHASSLVGDSGNVIAFEPYCKNHKAFEENIILNDMKNVTLVKQAIGDCRGQVLLSYNQKDSNLGMVSIFKNEFTDQEIVISDSLDNYLKFNELNSISYIKLDIEGAEYSALLGMKNTLKKYKPIVQIEIDDHILAKTPYRSADIYKFMNDLNYELFIPELLKITKIKRNKSSKNHFFRVVS